MNQLNLEAIDTDGAIREGAEAVAGDTRLSFLRKGAVAGGAAIGGGAILGRLVPGLASAKGAPPRSFGKGDIGILNFALTLEYLERAFYNEATSKGTITDPETAAFLKVVTNDERKHVAFSRRPWGARPPRSRSSTSTARPAPVDSSSRRRMSWRTPAFTPTSARPATSRPRRICSPRRRSSPSRPVTRARSADHR